MTATTDLGPLQRLLTEIDADRPDWHAEAACRGLAPDLFYPARGESLAAARSVCEGCPVQAECLNTAMGRNEKFGIWAATSVRQRRHLRRQRDLDRNGAAA